VACIPPDIVADCYRPDPPRAPLHPPEELYRLVSAAPQRSYEVREVLNCIVDAESFQEYKAEYGRTLVCGYARIGGYRVGVIANQKHPEKTAQHGLEFGGVIYVESAEKAARFVLDCNQNWLPLVFLQDVNGFMVGRDSEQSGIIKAGAKLVNAISNSRVPKLTVILGGSFGAGNYALCGKAFDPRFIYAWPSGQYAVMGGTQAASTLLDVQIASLKRAGKTPDTAELEDLKQQLEETYTQKTDIRYAAARGWVDDIIEPVQTRERLIQSLRHVTRHAGAIDFRTGVFQV